MQIINWQLPVSTTKTVTFDTDKFSTYALVYTPVDNGYKPSGCGSSGGGSTGGGGSSGNTTSGNTVSGNTTPDEDKLIITGTITDSKTKAAYTMNSDNTLTFEGPASKNVKKYIIPSSVVIDGKKYKVTKVTEKAFQKCKKLEKVVLPGSIVKIGEKAFAGCTNLKEVVIGENVTDIGESAFSGDKSLKVLKIKSDKLTKKGVKDALKGSKIKKVKLVGKAKKKKKAYKKFFTKKNCGKKVKVN